MNRLILALIISCGLTACSNNGTKKSASTGIEQVQPLKQKDRVEVLYFHGKQRCATCMAIEKTYQNLVIFKKYVVISQVVSSSKSFYTT